MMRNTEQTIPDTMRMVGSNEVVVGFGADEFSMMSLGLRSRTSTLTQMRNEEPSGINYQRGDH